MNSISSILCVEYIFFFKMTAIYNHFQVRVLCMVTFKAINDKLSGIELYHQSHFLTVVLQPLLASPSFRIKCINKCRRVSIPWAHSDIIPNFLFCQQQWSWESNTHLPWQPVNLEMSLQRQFHFPPALFTCLMKNWGVPEIIAGELLHSGQNSRGI